MQKCNCTRLLVVKQQTTTNGTDDLLIHSPMKRYFLSGCIWPENQPPKIFIKDDSI